MEVELTNMIMIRDPATGKVVAEERVQSWKGVTFPGGHVEPGESFYDAAVREAWEETGLHVLDLESCGVIHWCDRETDRRYVVFLYRTQCFTGKLTDGTEEGKVFWITPEELRKKALSPNFASYLPLFFAGGWSEAFGLHGGGEKTQMRRL